MDNQKNIPNRLIKERSPYLLQHGYNPVQWYPWSEEAFEKAKLEDKCRFAKINSPYIRFFCYLFSPYQKKKAMIKCKSSCKLS